MTRKTRIRFIIIVTLLIVFSVAAWIGVNMLVARRLSLIHLVEIGDTEAIRYICRWDPKQVEMTYLVTFPWSHRRHGFRTIFIGEQATGGLRFVTGNNIYDVLTPFKVAARIGNADAVSAFLQEKPDLIPAGEIRRAFIMAVIEGHGGVISAIVASGKHAGFFDDPHIVHLAAAQGSPELIKELVAAGFDINAKDDVGRSILQLSVARGRIEYCRALLACGADPNSSDRGGLTPLHEAADRSSFALIQALVGAGADINTGDHRGWTPLDYASGPGVDGTKDLFWMTPTQETPTVLSSFLRRYGAKTGDELRIQNVDQGTQK